MKNSIREPLTFLAALMTMTAPVVAEAEPAACLSPNPADWPASSKPYFMLAADTSGSMTSTVGNPAIMSSCGYGSDRLAHLRCSIRSAVQAFSGQVNFGLATFPRKMSNCGAACYTTCTFSDYPNNQTNPGCGPGVGVNRRGAFIQVPMLQDSFWQVPPPPNNTATMLSWVNNGCTGNVELFADGFTPLNGMLRDLKRYFSATGWTAQDNSVAYPTPLASQDLAGEGINGSTACRPVNIIFITDGGETCDLSGDAANVAADLFNNGVTVGGKTWKIRTYVINFAGGGLAESDAIAAAGGTGGSILANNEAELSTALSTIIGSSVQPETCNNKDDNCNGCTDEGSAHYCNVGQTCCVWSTVTQRNTCLLQYTATITAQDPDGDLTKLPCTTSSQQSEPASWLCHNPGDTCDNVDNNCSAGVDEGKLKCGNPPHCPVAETCNGKDDDCDGVIDDGLICAPCGGGPEVCDGCDNDCDGLIDEGIAPVACGQVSPANCAGQLACPQKNNPGGVPGTCVVGNPFGTCSNNPQSEICDGLDNDCDGISDDGAPAVACVPAGQPPNLDYGPASQCKKGQQACGSGQCIGFVGPSAEVCDGIDNDCDGVVDDNVFGIGLACGVNQPPCTPGLTACVNGGLVCQGAVAPTAESCDGIDNNCNGVVDETPLADAPDAGQYGCWLLPGGCCSFGKISWCPPPGATCNDVGALSPPCNHGILQCSGALGWVCQGATEPTPEVCDGIDNDCSGVVDDGSMPQIGDACGVDTGECNTGVLACIDGALDCSGDTPPSIESCDGLDNDCDGLVDNGVQAGELCQPAYDPSQYPNPPIFSPCHPGTYQCDPLNGLICAGSVGPSPEVCDGVDNDCDGNVDEPGIAPNGVDGTVDPQDPSRILGASCGGVGECSAGTLACVNGVVVCQGGLQPSPEECDCKDNDCDGVVDNGSNLCSAGKSCVAGAQGCACAEPCGTGEFPCPVGQVCTMATVDGMEGLYCFSEPCAGGCAGQKVVDAATGAIECAPAGTPAGADCIFPPVCVCKGQAGCHEPCFGVTCTGGLVCANKGPQIGSCAVDNCHNVSCVGCDSACHGNACTDNPCVPNPCAANEVCKPTADFQSHQCVGSCADVTCPAGQACADGKCIPTCNPACANDQVCDPATVTCVASKCSNGPRCTDGSCCDALTGNCGDCPCSGVVCPLGQECRESDGQCHSTSTGAGGSPDPGWGLATGGGGCVCTMASEDDESSSSAYVLMVACSAAFARRRRRERAS